MNKYVYKVMLWMEVEEVEIEVVLCVVRWCLKRLMEVND